MSAGTTSPPRPGHLRSALGPGLLLGAGLFAALLAVLDKVVGLVEQPQLFATLSYAAFCLALGWIFLRGLPRGSSGVLRLSVYAAFLLLNVLTAAYVFALRLGADRTPLLLQAHLARGDALLEAGEKDAAQLLYREALRRHPDSFVVLMRMGAISYQVSDFERARRYYERALALAPADTRWRVLNDLGQSLWKLGRPHEAIDLYLQAREQGMPAHEETEWHYRLGWAYFDAKDYPAAVEHYKAVARAGGKYAPASYYNIACAQAQLVVRERQPEERARLTQTAVEHLRHAWESTVDPHEKEALRLGLLGTDEERDHELDPLRPDPAMKAFLASIRGS